MQTKIQQWAIKSKEALTKALNLILYKIRSVDFSKSDLKRKIIYFKTNKQEIEKELNKYIDSNSNVRIKSNLEEPLIILKNINKTFITAKKKNVIFNDVNFDLYQKDFVAIIGPNGAGKTTLVELICGFSIPTEGKIIYNYHYDHSISEEMGVSFQVNNFIDTYTVWDYILLTIRTYKTKISIDELSVLLIMFGLEDKTKHKAASLSGGQQQRLNALLSLIHKPKILFLDEISNNLDINIRHKILEFLKKYIEKNNITGMIVSHDANEIYTLASKVIVLGEGKIRKVIDFKDKKPSIQEIKEMLEKNT